ncbi:phosphate/phosphite/phosphonate ABC transporter substrate-binding protein [Lichenihabitans psoromatis]|uniref:phosphate/phosphite/phosphonate ABC transporter substrate-binding protein n=1 Tax=Lichenihabitans psoromatis TaxID=2528642 RepID=UPI0013F160C8|nr:PhnD/SsuA/transferrin family substrate-binding protein [Lichenihabitans psoromatis]
MGASRVFRRMMSLPMYRAPAGAEHAFWGGLRRHLISAGFDDVPERPAEPEDLDAHWLDPDLLLSQTCGFPLTHALAGRVQLLGAPCYAAAGCDGVFYRSLVVVRQGEPARTIGDLRGRRVAYNSIDSQSGYNTLRALVAPYARNGAFFGATMQTGGHRGSVEAVQGGSADIASIDCVTYALLKRDEPDLVAGLRVLCMTGQAPSLPLITALGTSPADAEGLRRAIEGAMTDPDLAGARADLMLAGFARVDPSAYEICVTMERDAVALGYPVLA